MVTECAVCARIIQRPKGGWAESVWIDRDGWRQGIYPRAHYHRPVTPEPRHLLRQEARKVGRR